MPALSQLDLGCNLIDDGGVEVLVRGLAECKHLQFVSLPFNRIGDNGLERLIQGLPASVDDLDLRENEIALARQLPLLRFPELNLWNNPLFLDGPRVIAESFANPACRLESLNLNRTNIGDEGAAILATSLKSNRRLREVYLTDSNITETGWNAFRAVLCDTTSINATHGSNHSFRYLGGTNQSILQDVETLLELNHDQNKSRVAAKKILQTHHHLDMKPLFDRKLDLLPHVVAWLERFAESRLDHKLSTIYEFARAMPMDVVNGLVGKKDGKKRRRNS